MCVCVCLCVFTMQQTSPYRRLPRDRWRRREEAWRRVVHLGPEASRHGRQRRHRAGALGHVGHLHDQHFASEKSCDWWVEFIERHGTSLKCWILLDLSIWPWSMVNEDIPHDPWYIYVWYPLSMAMTQDPMKIGGSYHICLAYFWGICEWISLSYMRLYGTNVPPF